MTLRVSLVSSLESERYKLAVQIDGLKKEIQRISERRAGQENRALTPILRDLFETKRALLSKLEAIEEQLAVKTRARGTSIHVALLAARTYPTYDVRR